MYILLTFVVFSRDFPCSDYPRPLFKMTAQFFFIKEIAWNNVLSIHTFLYFTKSRLREKIQFFLKNCFNTEMYLPYLKKSVTHIIGWLTDPFTKKNDGGGVVGVVGVNQHFGETTFSLIIVIFVVCVCDCICDQQKSKGNFRWRKRKLFTYDKL